MSVDRVPGIFWWKAGRQVTGWYERFPPEVVRPERICGVQDRGALIQMNLMRTLRWRCHGPGNLGFMCFLVSKILWFSILSYFLSFPGFRFCFCASPVFHISHLVTLVSMFRLCSPSVSIVSYVLMSALPQSQCQAGVFSVSHVSGFTLTVLCPVLACLDFLPPISLCLMSPSCVPHVFLLSLLPFCVFKTFVFLYLLLRCLMLLCVLLRSSCPS